MSHRCVHCGTMYPDAAPELLKGCGKCGNHFFFYIRKEQEEIIKEKDVFEELNVKEKEQIETDVREMMGVESDDIPIILDLESIRIIGPGKFEIDIVNLFNKKRPLIYKLEEGKYIIDLASSLKLDLSNYKQG
ncbi:MAG: Zn-ribbon containing protein [Candidatus Pacearchaeota archaeon]